MIKMNKKIKIMSLTVMAMSCVAFGVASLNTTSASAADAPNFYLKEGASVYIGDIDTAGIRFQGRISNDYLQSLNADKIRYFMLVTAANNITAENSIEDLKWENKDDYEAVLIEDKTLDVEGTESVYYGAITYDLTSIEWTEEKKQLAYATDLVAKPFIEINVGGECTYEYADVSAFEQRSMRTVSQNALEMDAKDMDGDVTYSETEYNNLVKYLKSVDTKAVRDSESTAIEFIDSTTEKTVYVPTIVDGNLSFTTELDSVTEKTIGANTPIFVQDGDSFVYTSYKYVSKIVSDKEDWDGLGSVMTTNGTEYIVLKNDIKLSDKEYTSPFIDGNWLGVIDGYGHIVSNARLSLGMKGWFNGASAFAGTMKDIAFNNITQAGSTNNYSFFSTVGGLGKIENVIIIGQSSYNNQYNNLLAQQMAGTVKNCLVIDNSTTQLGSHTSGNGGSVLGSHTAFTSATAKYENTVLIADGAAFTERVDGVWTASEVTYAGINKVKHSDTAGQKEALATLNGKGYITYADGLLCFNGKALYVAEIVKQADAKAQFVVKDSENGIDLSSYKDIISVTVDGKSVAVGEGGKMATSAVSSKCGRYTLTVVYDGNKEINVPVVIADYVIADKDGWDDMGDHMTAAGTEYIVLAKDIDLSDTKYTSSFVTGTWLGVIDGYGHIVSGGNLSLGMNGWFNSGIFAGTMKDIAFNNITQAGSALNYSFFSTVGGLGKIENVIIIGQSSYNNQYNNLLAQSMGGTVKNCLIIDNSTTQLGSHTSGNGGSVLGTYTDYYAKTAKYENAVLIADGAAFTEKVDGVWTASTITFAGINKVKHSDTAGQSTALATLNGNGWITFDATTNVLSFNGTALYTVANS